MNKPKKIGLIILIVAYTVAGINHFWHPLSYIKIIPLYLPYPRVLNLLAGFCELWFAVLLIFTKTRQGAAWGIILMLIAFLPVHIQMVIDAPFLLGNSITVTPFIAWARLIILQPLLILWAWYYTKADKI
jgi:uncharacterized membrane protein